MAKDGLWPGPWVLSSTNGGSLVLRRDDIRSIFEEGSWAILEWRDPMGLRGCGFFRFEGGLIAFQRGHWDKLTFLRQQGLALPTS